MLRKTLSVPRSGMVVAATALLLLATAIAAAALSPTNMHGWTATQPAHSDDPVRLMVAIKQENAAELEEFLHDVSNPRSPNYGSYLTIPEVWKRVHGIDASVKAVVRFFSEHGMAFSLTQDSSFAIAHTTAAVASKALGADFYVYEHPRHANTTLIRTTTSALPSDLVDHVDFVIGHNTFPAPSTLALKQSKNNGQLGADPASIDKAYNLNQYTSTNPKSTQAVAGFLGQYFRKEDLATFQQEYNLPQRPITKTEGPDNDDMPGLEANLDVQYIGATGRNISTWFISTKHEVNHGQEDFLEWIIKQNNDSSSPFVHSVSYGDIEDSIPLDYKTRVEQEFVKFGASGRSILVAAGDSGVGCENGVFQPDWPTSSPHVTSVGGTLGDDETVWSDGGGGFSNTFASPSYQTAAVNAYLNSGKAPSTTLFNVTGRAYPDVSAFSTDFPIFYRGSKISVDGTSCAAPTFAGVVASLNDVRFGAGKSPLGFLNPLLYQLKSGAFNDITKGSNPNGMCKGFEAISGWDPASGWGSPNFEQLRKLVLELP